MLDSCQIHPTAVIETGASIGAGVRIGPFCHVGPEVVIGDRVELKSHVAVIGATTIGAETQVFPQATLGGAPQNNKHTGGRTTLIIGRNCTIREGVTMHVGTDTSRGETTVGDHGNYLALCHVAHDCVLGDHVTMANFSALAGHCEVGSHATISGFSGVHQYVRIGHHAFVGGMTALRGDLIPFGMAVGGELGGNLRGLNIVGLKRSGVPHRELKNLRQAYSMLFDEGQTIAANAGRILEAFPDSDQVADLANFVTERKNRHFCVPPRGESREKSPDEQP